MTSLLNPVVLRITLRATLGRKRALVFVLVPLVLLLITVALKLVATSPVWPAEFLGVFGFSVVLPLTALIIGTSVLGAEIDDGSIVHLLATPVSRTTVVLSKFHRGHADDRVRGHSRVPRGRHRARIRRQASARAAGRSTGRVG